jgi:hypothetical protein
MDFIPDKDFDTTVQIALEVEHLHDLIDALLQRIETLEEDLYNMNKVMQSPWWMGGKL